MEILNIPLDEETLAFLKQQAEDEGCESAEAYVAALIAADYKRWARENLNRLLLEGLESGPAKPLERRDWEDLRYRVHQHLEREANTEREVDIPMVARP